MELSDFRQPTAIASTERIKQSALDNRAYQRICTFRGDVIEAHKARVAAEAAEAELKRRSD